MMRRRLQIVGAFAAVGFVVPWLFLLYYAIARQLGRDPGTVLLLYVCPSSIASLGLDNASLLVGLIGWLLIGLSNAILYSIVGALVSIFVPRRSQSPSL